MSELPSVSIVINNHNYGRYLGAAIDSALRQDYEALEVVVVDDGSTDDSRAVIRRYGDRVTAVFKAQGGQASALNHGSAVARGDVVFFLDADDMLWPQAASTVVRAWTPDLAKAQFNLRFVDETGRSTGRLFASELFSGDLRADLLDGVNIYPPTTGNAYARTLLDKLLPIPEQTWSLHADAYLAWLAPFYGSVLSMTDPLGDFRLHGANRWKTSGNLSPERLRQELQLLLDVEALLKSRQADLGLRLAEDWLLSTPASLKVRLAYVLNVHEPALVPQDTRWSVTCRGVRSVWRFPRYRLAKRLLYAAWFLCVGLLPRSLTAGVQRVGLNPRSRSRLVSALTP